MRGNAECGRAGRRSRRSQSSLQLQWGWTAGGGIDYAFTNNWFTGIEYRYSQYPTKSLVYPIPILNLGLVGFKQDLSSNQVTARIGYKF